MESLLPLVSGVAGVVAGVVTARYTLRKDRREQSEADDREADRIIALKDLSIAELAARVDGLQQAINDLREKIRLLELQVDQYGCWNGPRCENRKPLGGPRPAEQTQI